MAAPKILQALVGTAADRAEAKASKLAAQLAETDRELAAAETRRTVERKALADALDNGDDASRPEIALAEIASTVTRLSERRSVLADLAEKATGAASEARRASRLAKAREEHSKALLEAKDAQRATVDAIFEAGRVAGRFSEASRRCRGAAAACLALGDESNLAPGPEPDMLAFALQRAEEAQGLGLRRIGSMALPFTFYGSES